ncbi:MAG TPA: hypothetical protein H9693_02890 [Firmicutes bacterium]|nr:hypothetical protein [Bacillota bacterium]
MNYYDFITMRAELQEFRAYFCKVFVFRVPQRRIKRPPHRNILDFARAK